MLCPASTGGWGEGELSCPRVNLCKDDARNTRQVKRATVRNRDTVERWKPSNRVSLARRYFIYPTKILPGR